MKVHAHVMSAFAFLVCYQILENTNIKCKRHHLLPKNSFLTLDANANEGSSSDMSLMNDRYDSTNGDITRQHSGRMRASACQPYVFVSA